MSNTTYVPQPIIGVLWNCTEKEVLDRLEAAGLVHDDGGRWKKRYPTKTALKSGICRKSKFNGYTLLGPNSPYFEHRDRFPVVLEYASRCFYEWDLSKISGDK